MPFKFEKLEVWQMALNIAEGSTGQTDPEQNRFLGLALRSLIETVACQRIIKRRKYLLNDPALDKIDAEAESLAIKIQSFRKSLGNSGYATREDAAVYEFNVVEN